MEKVVLFFPPLLGMLVLGVSRLRYQSLKPQFEGEREAKQVAVHQRYVEDSVSLFLLYFLQLAVMAAYLNQDLLKLVPLLTIVFAFGRYKIPSKFVGPNLWFRKRHKIGSD